MEERMRECIRKLALWYTKTFKPVMTHDELEPIMATLGFMGQPPRTAPNGFAWKEYVYAGAGSRAGSEAAVDDVHLMAPRPMLPYQRIDGLHIYTYSAFIEAVNFYLKMDDISELFHIRGMPLHRVNDRNKKFRRMEADESIFVYREGTVDPATCNLYRLDKSNSGAGGGGNSRCFNNSGISTFRSYNSSIVIRNKGNNSSIINVGNVVPLKDII